MATPDTSTWQDLLVLQDRVLARGQALRSGLSEDAWQWRLDTRRWQAVLPGVVVAHDGPPTELQMAWAGLLYAGPGAALSGLAALRLDGLTLDAERVDVAIPAVRQVRPQRRTVRDGRVLHVVARRVADLDRLAHPHRLPRRTRPPVAALHAAAWARTDRAAETFVAAAVQQRLVQPGELAELLARLPRLPRRALLLQVLEDVGAGAHARGELDLLDLLRRSGLPLPDRLQHGVRAGGLRYLDAWYEQQRVAVEVDGAHHRSVGTWEADLLRSNALAVQRGGEGVLLLRFTNGQLRHAEAEVVRQLRAALLGSGA